MPVLVPHAELAQALGVDRVESSVRTVGALLEEVRGRVDRDTWERNRRVALLVNGRNIHYLQGNDTVLEPGDVVWMVLPSGGG